jgi:hypothetical protein
VDLLVLDVFDLHLDEAVVDEQDAAGRNRPRHLLEGNRDPLAAAGDFFGGQGEAAADSQVQGFLGQGADADLGAGQMQTILVLQGGSVGALYIRSLQGFEQVSREAEGSNVLWSIANHNIRQRTPAHIRWAGYVMGWVEGRKHQKPPAIPRKLSVLENRSKNCRY